MCCVKFPHLLSIFDVPSHLDLNTMKLPHSWIIKKKIDWNGSNSEKKHVPAKPREVFFRKKSKDSKGRPRFSVIFFIVHSRRIMIPFDGRDFITSMGKFGNANKLPLDAKLDANSVGSQVSHRNEWNPGCWLERVFGGATRMDSSYDELIMIFTRLKRLVLIHIVVIVILLAAFRIYAHFLKQCITTLHHFQSQLPEPSPRNSSDFSCFYSGWPCRFIHFIHFDPNFIPFFGVQTSRGKTFSSFTRGGRPIIFPVGNPRGLRKRRANFEARKGGATTESPVTMEAIELCFGEEIEEVARTLWWFGFGVGEDGGEYSGDDEWWMSDGRSAEWTNTFLGCCVLGDVQRKVDWCNMFVEVAFLWLFRVRLICLKNSPPDILPWWSSAQDHARSLRAGWPNESRYIDTTRVSYLFDLQNGTLVLAGGEGARGGWVVGVAFCKKNGEHFSYKGGGGGVI